MTLCPHCPFPVAEIRDLQVIRDVRFPAGVKFRQIIVTGPPCSGKSTLVRRLGGWPEEGALDLAEKSWWKSRILTFRPREVHFLFPFTGLRESYAVFDREWTERPAEIDFDRIRVPPPRRGLFGTDWRNRYAFDFQLPDPERLFGVLEKRRRAGTHRVDASVTLELVQRQVRVYAELARFFHRSGMLAWVRVRFDGPPLRIGDDSV